MRKLNDASHLALDTTCLLPSNFHFLRQGILVDSQDTRAFAKLTVDTLHSKFQPIVTYSVKGTSVNVASGVYAISKFGIPTSYFQPILQIGQSAINSSGHVTADLQGQKSACH